MKYEWLHHNTFQLLQHNTFQLQKCISGSEFDLFCKRTRQALSNSLTSSVAEVFRFLFLSCFGVILQVRYYGQSNEVALYWTVK